MKEALLALSKDSIIYGVGSVITRFIGLATLPLFTTYITPAEYGILAVLALLAMFVQPIFSLGLSAAMGLSYFEKDDLTAKSTVVWSMFVINLVSASLLILLAWTQPTFLAGVVALPDHYSHLISVSLTGTALTILVTSFMQHVQFEKQASLYVAITAMTTFTVIFISIYTVVFLGWGVEGMVYGQVLGNIITFLAFLATSLKSTFPKFSGRIVIDLLRSGIPLVPSFVFLFILMNANRYILEWHAGLDSLGIYSIGFNLGMAISIVTGGIATAWYPFFISFLNRQDEAQILFGRLFTYFFMAIGWLCATFFIFAKPVVHILTQDEFYEAYLVVGFVALANFCIMLFNFFLPSLYFRKNVKHVSVVQGSAAIVSVPISYLLIERYLIVGAAVAVFISHLLMAIFLYTWNRLGEDESFAVTYDWRRVLHISVSFTLLVILYFYFSTYFGSFEMLASMFFTLLCLGAIYFLLSGDERMAILMFLRSRAKNEL